MIGSAGGLLHTPSSTHSTVALYAHGPTRKRSKTIRGGSGVSSVRENDGQTVWIGG